MTQIAPFLKPPKGRPGGACPAGPPCAAPGASLRTPAPVAGFWRRLGALLFDMLAMYALFRVVSSLFGDQLLKVGPAAAWCSSLFVYLYFALAAGPVGRGRTLGKWLAGTRITALDGSVPSLGQGFLRTIVLFPAFLFALVVNPLALDKSSFYQAQVGIILTSYLSMAACIGIAFSTLFNPFKQGFHDFLAKTVVRPAAAGPMTFDEMKDLVGPGWVRYQRQAQINGLIPMTMAFILLILMSWPPKLYSQGYGEKYEIEQRLLAETPFADADILLGILPLEEAGGSDPAAPSDQGAARTAFLADLADAASSETLRVELVLSRVGNWDDPPEALEEPARDFADIYRREIFGALPSGKIFPRSGGLPTNMRKRPLVFDVILERRLQLFLFPYRVTRDSAIRVEFPSLLAYDAADPLEAVRVGDGGD